MFKPVSDPGDDLDSLFTVDKTGCVMTDMDRRAQPALSPWSSRPAFNKNGNSLFVGTLDGEIMGWDIVRKQLIHKVQAHDGYVLDLLYLRDKDVLISTGADKAIKSWSFAA